MADAGHCLAQSRFYDAEEQQQIFHVPACDGGLMSWARLFRLCATRNTCKNSKKLARSIHNGEYRRPC